MLIVGLTGSIGMGKSTIAKRFRHHGIAVCDADAVVHGLYEGAAVGPIEAAFPGTTHDGKVDRQALGAVLIEAPERFAELEAIVHPLVLADERAFLLTESEKDADFAVLEVPLLFETGADARVDITVLVSAPSQVQRQRVLERPGMTAEKLDTILSRQIPDAEKRQRADFIVDTGQSIEQSYAEVDRVIDALGDRPAQAFARHWAAT